MLKLKKSLVNKKIRMIKDIIKILTPLKNIRNKALLVFWAWITMSFSASFSTIAVKKIVNYLESGDIDWAKNIILIFTIIYIFAILYIYSQKNNIVDLEEWLRRNLLEKYLTRFISIDNQKFEVIWNGKMISAIKSWVDAWIELVILILITFTITIFYTSFALVQVFLISKMLFLVMLLILIMLFLIIKNYNEEIDNLWKKSTDIKIEIDKNVIKVINSKFEILQNSLISKKIEYIENHINDNKKNLYQYSKLIESIHTFSNVFILLMRVWLFVYFLYLYNTWLYDTWTFTMLVTVILLLDWTLNYFIKWYKDFIWWIKDIKKMDALFLETEQMNNINSWNFFNFYKGDIEIKNLSFSYNGKNTKVFKKFNLSIHWWQKIALIWPTWNWKTTLIKLISWYINHYDWSIKIDWQEIKDLNLLSYYANIWYLQQETSLFDWTIKDNLISGNTKISDKEIEKVLKEAECDFVLRMEKWMYTEIWDKWVMLSWWQKQRIGIAKIMLKNPKIIFLDEPTSALDYISEAKIQRALDKLFKWKTVITIAHRLKTIKNSDIIYYIEGGKIIESGNHNELMKKRGKYYNLNENKNI